jgi:hypothetical protein
MVDFSALLSELHGHDGQVVDHVDCRRPGRSEYPERVPALGEQAISRFGLAGPRSFKQDRARRHPPSATPLEQALKRDSDPRAIPGGEVMPRAPPECVILVILSGAHISGPMSPLVSTIRLWRSRSFVAIDAAAFRQGV